VASCILKRNNMALTNWSWLINTPFGGWFGRKAAERQVIKKMPKKDPRPSSPNPRNSATPKDKVDRVQEPITAQDANDTSVWDMIPTWLYYVVGGGLVYYFFFKKKGNFSSRSKSRIIFK